MKLTNNILEQLIMEVLGEGRNQSRAAQVVFSDIKDVTVTPAIGPDKSRRESYTFQMKDGELKVIKSTNPAGNKLRNPTIKNKTTMVDFLKDYGNDPKLYAFGENNFKVKLNNGDIFKLIDLPDDVQKEIKAGRPSAPPTFDQATFDNLVADHTAEWNSSGDQTKLTNTITAIKNYLTPFTSSTDAAVKNAINLYNTIKTTKNKIPPAAYDSATMTKYKDAIETATTRTSKNNLDAAKVALVNYVKSFGTIANGVFTPTDSTSPDTTDTATINAALAKTLQFNDTAFDTLVQAITKAETNKDSTALQKGKDDLKDYYDNFDLATNTAANAKKPDYDDAMKASIPVDFKDTFNAKTSSKPTGVKVNIPTSDQFNYDIKSVPQELKSLILRLFGQELKNKGATSDIGILKSFAGIAESLLKENTDEIDWKDFEYILRDKEDTSTDSAGNTITTEKPLYRKAIMAIKQAQNVASGTNFERALSKLAQDYGIDLSKPTPGAAAQATFSPDLADLYGHANRAKVPAYVVSLYGSLGLSNTKDVETRINVLNDTTKKIIDTKGAIDKKKFSIGEILSITSVASNMARIAKLMDDKAAGWAFEGFLSQLVDGQGLGVGMGAADFKYGIQAGTIPAGSLGSAKLIKGNGASQSATTLGDALGDGDSMYYIVGKKVESDYKTGTATQADIAAVALYFVELKRADGKKKGTNGSSPITYNSTSKKKNGIPSKAFGIKYGPVGSANTYCKMLSNSPEFKITSQSPFGIIYFHKDLANLDKFNAKAMETVSTQLPNLIKAMNEFRQRTTRYLSSGEISSGEKAADEYAELMNLINSVFEDKAEETGMSIGVEVSGTSLQRKATQVKQTDFSDLAESKLQTLDQLIAETMRDIKRKRKK